MGKHWIPIFYLLLEKRLLIKSLTVALRNQQSFEAMRLEYHLSSSALRKIIQHMNNELKTTESTLPKMVILLEKKTRFVFLFNFIRVFDERSLQIIPYLFSQETYKVMFAELEQVFQSHFT